MTSETDSISYVDLYGTSDLPSAEAGLSRTPSANRYEWASRLGHTLAGSPGYLLAAAALAGFVVGRVAKRLLLPNRSPS